MSCNGHQNVCGSGKIPGGFLHIGRILIRKNGGKRVYTLGKRIPMHDTEGCIRVNGTHCYNNLRVSVA